MNRKKIAKKAAKSGAKARKNSVWLPPKGAQQYFSPSYNDRFKKQHRVLYFLVIIVDLLIVLIPMIGFILLAGAAAPPPQKPVPTLIFGVLGMLGSAAMAIGLANIWMAALKQYLGHLVTLIGLGGGTIVAAFSLWMLYLFA